jgi:transposase
MSKRGPKAFSEEFRREAVRLAETRPVAQVARELGVHPETLRGWRRIARARGERGETTPATVPEMEAEMRRLRREVERLREEREILKKATAFFARDAR